jgi:zinc protease
MRKRFLPTRQLGRIGLALALAAAAMPTLAQTVPVVADPVPDVSTLPDGARLVVLVLPKESRIVIDVFFRVGQSDEGRWPGIDALVTRAWAAGSDNRIAPLLQGDIARNGEGIGTSIDRDYTELWGVSAADETSFAQSAQTLLTNLVSAPLFEKDAVETARTAQIDSIQLRRDDLLSDVMDELQHRAFGESAYASPVIGTEESVRSLPAPVVGAYYRKYFRPDRAVIVVAGPVTVEGARRRIAASIEAGGWNEGSPAPAPRPEAAAPIPAGLRDQVVPRRAPATCVAVGYLAPGTDSATGPRDYAALLALDAVLGGGKASRLFRLRDQVAPGETPVGYEIRSVLFPARKQSLLAAYVLGDGAPVAVRDRLTALLHDLGTGGKPVTPDELARARTYLKARHLESRQRLREQAFGIGWAETMGIGAAFDTSYDARLDAVTLDDINAVARRVFSGNPAVVHSLPAP